MSDKSKCLLGRSSVPLSECYDVLVLEDDDLIRDLLIEVCEENHFCAQEADSIAAGYAILKSSGFRVLVADNNLGSDESGFAFARMIRKKRPDLGVIYITGKHSSYNDMMLTEKERALPKPFTVKSLVEAIRDLLGGDVMREAGT